jgi:hypothetical protein
MNAEISRNFLENVHFPRSSNLKGGVENDCLQHEMIVQVLSM